VIEPSAPRDRRLRWHIDYKNDEGDADFHALRHTFISQLLSDGATELARHSDVQITMRYSRVQQAEALAKLDFGDAMVTDGCHSLTLRDCAPISAQRSNHDLRIKKPSRDSDCHDLAFFGSGANHYFRAEDTGVEPATLAGN